MKFASSLSIALIAAALACAPPSTTAGGIKRDPAIISLAEIQQSMEPTAYDVVSKLRPNFLHNRGKSTVLTEEQDVPAVFVDNQYFGDLESLKNIVSTNVQEIRLYGPTDVGRFGMQYKGGVIAVKTRS